MAQGSDRGYEEESAGPLTGLRVLDLGTMFAGPLAASLLADFGADVIKVELPTVGDANRGMAPIVKGIPGPWTIIARNKRSISLDIRKPQGRELVKRLLARTDVVVENFRPGTLERWGLGYEEMKQANPRIILVRISGYGQTGPYSEKAGFGTPAAAFSGITYMQGFPDRAPVSPPYALADDVAGVFGAMAALMAIYRLKVHGDAEGQQIDIGLYEPMLRFLDTVISQYDLTGVVRERAGHISQGAAPAGSFRCQDGKWVVMVSSTDRTFNRLAEVMGRADLITDPRFCTNAQRSAHREEIIAIVEEWFSRQPSAEAIRLLDENGVPVSLINSMEDIFSNEHVRARENLIEVSHPVLGKVTMPGIVPKFSATPGRVRFPGPVRVGEHNEEILQGELGLSADELEELKRQDII